MNELQYIYQNSESVACVVESVEQITGKEGGREGGREGGSCSTFTKTVRVWRVWWRALSKS